MEQTGMAFRSFDMNILYYHLIDCISIDWKQFMMTSFGISHTAEVENVLTNARDREETLEDSNGMIFSDVKLARRQI